MTIPKDVRTAAYTLMQRHLTEPFANDEERWLVLRQADDACELLDAWLDTQSDAPEREAMTMPDDVRDIIQDALYSYKAIAMGIQDVTGESREDVLVAIDAACAWLKGQPSERWQPVGDGCHGNIRQRAGNLYLDMGIENDEYMILLPKGYAFCRLVEVTE